MTVKIPLTQQLFAIVDQDDAEFANRWKWSTHNSKSKGSTNFADKFYAATAGNLRLHWVIWERHNGPRPEGAAIRFKNYNSLDCRKQNLELATTTELRYYKKPQSGPRTSQYKGVYWSTKRNRFVVNIQKDKRSKYIGSFIDEQEAARAYDEAALELYGEKAYFNFPDEVQR